MYCGADSEPAASVFLIDPTIAPTFLVALKVILNKEKNKIHTEGKSIDGVRIKILNDEKKQVSFNKIGLIQIEGKNLFSGYLDRNNQVKQIRKFLTSDLGYLDEDGYLYLTDRKAFMIISGGVNIYPKETEDTLIMHPKVADVAVFGVPHEEMGEEVKAVVQPKDMSLAGDELEQELMAYCRENISHVKCPKSIDFEEELPRHPTGKLYKRLLKDRYWK